MMAQELKRVDLDGDAEVEQAARILTWVASEKAKIKTKLNSLDAAEADARSVIEEALGGADGDPAEGVFQGRPVVRWTKFTTRRFDSKALLKAEPEVHAKYYTSSTTRRFEVVPPEEKS